MAQQKFSGTGVAIITPFRNDGSIDFKSLTKLLEYIISNGVNYIVALGTTGESVTLSKDEKQAVISCVIEIVSKRVPVVVGIGGNNTQEILNAQGQMVKVPFDSCKPALANLKKIIGLKLNTGVTGRIADAIGVRTGCIHLSEVTVETVRLAANTIFGIKCGGRDWREGRLSDEEFWGRVKPLLKGTCIVFPEKED